MTSIFFCCICKIVIGISFGLQELEKEKQAEAMRLKEYPPFGSGAVLEVALVSLSKPGYA